MPQHHMSLLTPPHTGIQERLTHRDVTAAHTSFDRLGTAMEYVHKLGMDTRVTPTCGRLTQGDFSSRLVWAITRPCVKIKGGVESRKNQRNDRCTMINPGLSEYVCTPNTSTNQVPPETWFLMQSPTHGISIKDLFYLLISE